MSYNWMVATVAVLISSVLMYQVHSTTAAPTAAVPPTAVVDYATRLLLTALPVGLTSDLLCYCNCYCNCYYACGSRNSLLLLLLLLLLTTTPADY